MAGGKSTQPLFELLAKGQGDALTRQARQFIPGREPDTPGSPEKASSPQPDSTSAAPISAASPTHAGRTASSAIHTPSPSPHPIPMAPDRRIDAKGVTIPMVWLYVSAGLLVGVLFIAWSVGFNRGQAAERAGWQRDFSSGVIGADPLIDPNAKSAPGPRGGDPKGTSSAQPGPNTDRNQNLSSSLLGSGRAGILTSGGVLSADPRQPGRNYLKLATLGRADTERAIEYLAAGGVEAIGIPVVDPKAGGANNPARYEIFATVGITGEEYANNRPVRSDLEAKISRLGERFKREAKGPTDFSKPLWMKHNP